MRARRRRQAASERQRSYTPCGWRAGAPANASPWSVSLAIRQRCLLRERAPPAAEPLLWRKECSLRVWGGTRVTIFVKHETGYSGDHKVRQAASEMRTIRSLTRKSEGIHAGKRCITITVPAWPKAVKLAALEAARSSPRGGGWTLVGRPLPGSAELPGAARRALRRHRSRAWTLPEGQFDRAAVLSLLLPSSPHSSLTRGSISLFCLASISSGETGLSNR